MRLKYNYSDTPKIYYKNAATATHTISNPTITTLEQLNQYVCSDLDHPLKATALSTVFSNGIDSPIMVIGEAPGEEEDKTGQPFVGKSGQLLMQVFASIGLTRENLYITNLVPWRPPANRTPSFEEMDFFLPILRKHIILKKPRIIVLLGSVVTKALISKTIIISKVRGTIMDLDIDGTIIKVMPTFHPSYLLRSPQMKKLAWEDMCTLQKFIV